MPDNLEDAPGRRWLMLALGTAAQTAASCLLFGLPFLLPYLRRADGLSLAQAGALVAAPSLGLVLTLIALGTQNTAQNLVAFGTGPLVGALAGSRGFGFAFAACAAFPLLGALVTPVRHEHRREMVGSGSPAGAPGSS